MGLLSGFFGLSKDINKAREDETSEAEGVVSSLTPELELSMDDDELISLAKQWKKEWEPYQATVSKMQTDNENYWLGQQFRAGETKKSITDNIIFEALETFLPVATRPRADPTVEADDSPAGKALADRTRKMIMSLADDLSYNLILKQAVRYWALYFLGVIKVGWSERKNEITCVAVRPQKLILDPQATIEQGEYTGYYIGEYLKDTASDLIKRFPKQKAVISDKANGKMGTTLQYIQWWTDEYLFWTLENEVLAKSKNPHWDYGTTQPAPVDDYGNVPSDPTGMPQTVTVEGKNHFSYPQKPYRFLSIFNLGKQPHDETNHIQQVIPLQDLINKRIEQLDKNADNTNNGLALSGDAFTEEQAKKAAAARRKGGALWVPTGKITDAVLDLPSVPLPNFIYESLVDYRNEMRNIFGTRGSTPQGTMNERTATGKAIMQGSDTSRTGGGVSVYLEQLSDGVFNWFVQLMHVYYDEAHTASVLGREKAIETVSLQSQDFGIAKLKVGVKDGSMIPHDPMSERNEAAELMMKGVLDPITFFDRLEFPNPRESAKNLYLWKADPIQLFPELAARQAQAMAMAKEEQGQAVAGQQQVEVKKEGAKSQNKMKEIAMQGLVKGLVQNAVPAKIKA